MRRRSPRPGRDHLSRYWNALVRGAPAEELARLAEPIDPTMLDTIDRVRAAHRPRPDPIFAARLEDDLMTTFATPTRMDTVSLRPADRPPTDRRGGARAWVPTLPSPQQRQWGRARLVAAALVLVAVAFGYLAIQASRPDRPRVIPAVVVQSETPAPSTTPAPTAPTEQTLLEAAFPAAELPPGNAVMPRLHSYTIAAGARGTHEPGCCPGPAMEYVVSGAYTVRVEGAIQVVRADGMTEEVPGGTEVVLGPGDGLLWRNEMAAELANSGETPVELVSFTLLDDSEEEWPIYLFDGWSLDQFSNWGPLSVPPVPVVVSLRRVELAGDSDLPVPAGALQLVVLSSERPAGTPTPHDVATLEDGTFRNFGRGAVIVYVLTMEATGDAAGSPVAGTPVPF